MPRWSDFFLGATVGIIGCVAILMMSRQACADDLARVEEEKVRPVVESVVGHFHEIDVWPEVKADPLPEVYMSDLRGLAGMVSGGKIILNRNRQEGCFEADLAHEAVHWLLGKYRGLTPSQSEMTARAMETLIAPRDFNCWSKS